MKEVFCAECGADNHRVIDTDRNNPNYVRRRRECLICGNRFTTYERIRPERGSRKKEKEP